MPVKSSGHLKHANIMISTKIGFISVTEAKAAKCTQSVSTIINKAITNKHKTFF